MKEKLWILPNKRNTPVANWMLLSYNLKLKEGPLLVKENKMFGPQLFLQVKYET